MIEGVAEHREVAVDKDLGVVRRSLHVSRKRALKANLADVQPSVADEHTISWVADPGIVVGSVESESRELVISAHHLEAGSGGVSDDAVLRVGLVADDLYVA